ncbi:probable receptor-like protein kinase At5g24010 [Herrania umbratica]|uniref:Probable receptor-like protein kinase At5g24010 n=1 Tax=Herrania umbratica TaxID=108875 RepID=A0A6J1BNZ7_9ROSI|nr:probable receptor-like protein kinase At5g24010 [Herrania umbratica]XP_021300788.1 probable receptor-like protein kinase At5g24010 [Herrania umbratica]
MHVYHFILIHPTRILLHLSSQKKQQTPVSVEMLHSFSVLFSLLPLLLFCSLLFSPAEAVDDTYSLPYEHFINCGSKSSVTFGIRNFTQDQNSGPFSGKGSKPVKDTKPSADTPPLYQTARIFRRPYPYKFKIGQKGTYLVRLHFFAFTSSVSLADAVFNVSAQPDASAPGLLLLSNFTMKNSHESAVIKEFLLTVGAGKFEIYFIPSQISCLAFVNAIEVFLAPTGFIPDNATHINFSGIKDNYHGLLCNVLQKIYRINVGGSNITAKTDTLMRYWIPDDQFLLFPGSAENRHKPYVKLEYERGANGSTKYIAPEDVYRTAKKLTSGQTNFSNITWRFKVNEHARHFVRAHFCDFISLSLHYPGLNLCINGKFCQLISSYEIVNQLTAPFYVDFVVDSGKSGNIDISVGPNSSTDQTAFLNGLEIMQLMENSCSSFVPPKHKKKILVIIAGSLGLAFAFIIIVVVIVCLVCLKEDLDKVQRLPSSLALLGGWSVNEMSTARTAGLSLCLELRIPFAEIQQATQDFDSKFFIGEGGFGKVYCGTLRAEKVAVKRRAPGHKQGLAEFQTEIMVLSRTRHRNLVSLIGYCDERSEMILVYEFMEKGTLRDNLYDTNGCSKQNGLSWTARLEICIGTATALHYLHTGSAVKIIHRDIKSTNILLDENYTAKLSDFGISKSSHSDITLNHTGVKGSFGYLDPEYFMSSELTEKSDVYSFGVVLLEVLCARPAIINSPQEEVNLADWGLLWLKKGQLEKIIDPVLVDKINPDSLRKFGELVEKCLEAKGTKRPTMRDVLWDLEYALSLHTGINREQPDESITNSSLQFGPPVLLDVPTSSFLIEENEQSIVGNHGSDTSASEVFSQLKFAGAR